jgi:phenylpyruvate tautomerase PptA (4-oxalocrotonate tautomerase family)
MPYLKITTNKSVDEPRKHRILTVASKAVADALGKPEQYMMVSVDGPVQMTFGGSAEPCAHFDLRSIGLPESKTAPLSKLLCQLAETELGVRPDRVYINFSDVPPSHWGWNGETF